MKYITYSEKYMTNSKKYMTNSVKYMTYSVKYMTYTEKYMINSVKYMTYSEKYMTNSVKYMTNSEKYMTYIRHATNLPSEFIVVASANNSSRQTFTIVVAKILEQLGSGLHQCCFTCINSLIGGVGISICIYIYSYGVGREINRHSSYIYIYTDIIKGNIMWWY